MDKLEADDPEASDLLKALIDTAISDGLDPEGNANLDDPDSPLTHRAPVGDAVRGMKKNGYPTHGFGLQKPMPWTGELLVESEELKLDFRLYFIEGRSDWTDPTDVVVGGDLCSKGVALAYDPKAQTVAIRDSMNKAISVCRRDQHRWRPWNES